jgi:uncharacterized protein
MRHEQGPAMNHDFYDDAVIAGVLGSVKRIALLGASPNAARPSHGVMRFLLSKGYDVVPVNPGQAGGQILGRDVYATLSDIPGPVDMVDVFRASDALPGIYDEVLALATPPKAVWTQLAIRDDTQAARAEARGITVIQNRCPAIEIPRLGL